MCKHGIKTTPVFFYQLMEKNLGRYFQVRSLYYQVAQCNQKRPIPVWSKWQVRSQKIKKGQTSTLITAITSKHLPKLVSTDLTIKSDSVLTNPHKKKKKKKTDQAGHHPSISMSREFQTCFTSENNYLFSLIIFYDYTTDIVYIIDFTISDTFIISWTNGRICCLKRQKLTGLLLK